MIEAAELWIRLKDGRSIRERYNQLEMAEFMREAMLDRLIQGKPLVCFDGEELEVAANDVRRIDLLVGRESRISQPVL